MQFTWAETWAETPLPWAKGRGFMMLTPGAMKSPVDVACMCRSAGMG